jgi:transcriptional regulator with XRE-family HTH domain
MKTVAERIRSARQSARLTQTQLADELSVTRSAVAQWESRAGSAPSTANFGKLALALHCSYEWIATGRGSRHVGARGPQAGGDGAGVAVLLEYFARNDVEEQLLTTFRELSEFDQQLAVSLVEQLSARPLAKRARVRP